MEKQEFISLIKTNGSENLGWNTNRLRYDSKDIENALSEHWKKENIKQSHINHGYGILQDLFILNVGWFQRIVLLKITFRDRLIVATVIQWLGTNCGFCFLNEALNKAGYEIVKRKR